MALGLTVLQHDRGGDGKQPPASPPEARRDDVLRDAHGRVVRDVRVSVTDRCNYRCIYCMDPDHRYMQKQSLLAFDEYLTVVRACAMLGLHKLRITGGEPTLYPQLDDLIASLGSMAFDDIAMTTNGSLLRAERVQRWSKHGLDRLTFSLDSVRDERVAAITRTRATSRGVAEGIRLARDAGLDPIKVNAVIMRGVNDDEIVALARFARDHAVDLRLIEWMPLDSGRTWDRTRMVSADEMLEAITGAYAIEREERDHSSETSLNFRFTDGAPGRIGIIASVTRPFCGACSRLRITADGKVRPCLFSTEEWDLRPLLRNGAGDDDVAQFIADAMWTKWAGHGIGRDDFVQPARGMSAIGG